MRVIGNDLSHLVIESASRGHGRALSARVLTVLLAVSLNLTWFPTAAHAVTISAVLAPTSNLVNATATYGCTASTRQGGFDETVPSAKFTFPPNTILTGVSVATIHVVDHLSGDSYLISNVATDQPLGTVSFDIAFPQNKKAENIDVSVDGVVNASQPGTYTYSVTLPSSKWGSDTLVGTFTLVANATAVTVGAITATPATEALAAAYTIPVTVGAVGRLASDAFAGPNTISVTFPDGFTVPSSPPAGSVTINGWVVTGVTVAGRTVTLAIPAGRSIPAGGTATIALSTSFGLTNPPAGTYTITASTSAQTGTGTSPAFTIQGAQYLSITIGPATLDFGSISPGAATPPQTVTVHVSSSGPYAISRVPSGDIVPLGFAIAGQAVGAKGAGTADWVDSIDLTPPWSTDPGVPLQVTVQYTVVQ